MNSAFQTAIRAAWITTATLTLGACASSSSNSAEIAAVADADSETSQTAGPAVDLLPEESAEQPPLAHQADAPPAETIAAAPEQAPVIRSDGRPVWWIDAPVEDGSQIRVCAEALGTDLVSARRNAVTAARSKLRDLLGLRASDPLEGERILRTSAMPLPPANGAVAKYAAYVEMVAERPS